MSFKEQWDRMTVVERIAYIRADWQSCQETHDPLVLRIASAVSHDVCRQAADEIERLRKERDEARREVCWIMQKTGFMRGDYANSRGWDCFKDPEGPCPDAVSTFLDVIENDEKMWVDKVDQQRKVLDWVLPQLFKRIYPEYDLGHPHMYVLITAVKQPDGGIPKDMWDTIQPFLDAKP